MEKLLFVAFHLIIISQLALAQDEATAAGGVADADTTYWTSEFSAGLNFNQAGFSSNWKAGGVNSVAFGSIVAGKAFYRKDKFSWDNEMEL